MTVAELIAKLQRLPQDLEVFVPWDGCNYDKVSVIKVDSLTSHTSGAFEAVLIESDE